MNDLVSLENDKEEEDYARSTPSFTRNAISTRILIMKAKYRDEIPVYY